jgi:magnesium-transporting ATPase (P-type)
MHATHLQAVGWQALPLAELLKQLEASEQGLSSREAWRRLAALGLNGPSPARRFGTLLQVVLLFVNPLAIILLLASLVSAVLGEVLHAITIAVVVLLSGRSISSRPSAPTAPPSGSA